jgi:hypothetical protein
MKEWPLAAVVRLELRPLGGTLTDARLWSRQSGQSLSLYCLEQGDALADALGLMPQVARQKR